MEFLKYYQDELLFLREMGEEFSREFPKLAPFLARKGNDPDVERLLEGFAFIGAQLRQKLEDEFPELTHGMFSLLWPHYLRPVPSAAVLQFVPVPNAVSEKKAISRGIEVDSVPVEGTPCRFRTCYDVDLYPLTLADATVRSTGSASFLTLKFETLGGVPLAKIGLDKLRLFLHGELSVSTSLFLWLHQHLRHVTVRNGSETAGVRLGKECIARAGFGDDEELVPYPKNAFAGYRLLQEYFSLPQKFLFVDVLDLGAVAAAGTGDQLTLEFEFAKPLEAHVRPTKANFLLHCTPIINAFARDGDPLRVGYEKVDYRVRPATSNPSHYEIFSIEKVTGWEQGSGIRHTYLPFISFDPRVMLAEDGGNRFYQIRRKPAVSGKGIDTYLSFVHERAHNGIPGTEVVSVELICTNSHLPEKLREGDIHVATGNSPEFATFHNVTPPTPSFPPPIRKGLDWLLISNMSLNYLSLTNIEALRTIITTYNFPSFYNAQAGRAHELRMEGLSDISASPVTLMIRGAPVRGMKTVLKIRSSKFSTTGEAFLFVSVLSELFSLYTSINSFNQLYVSDIDKGEEYQWAPKTGSLALA